MLKPKPIQAIGVMETGRMYFVPAKGGKSTRGSILARYHKYDTLYNQSSNEGNWEKGRRRLNAFTWIQNKADMKTWVGFNSRVSISYHWSKIISPTLYIRLKTVI